AIPRAQQQITFEVMGFANGEAIDYYVDGKLYKREIFPRFPFWQLQRGDHTLTVKIREGEIGTVKFMVR
ncbi:MAG TPA: hypothetical protein VK469_07750, partial [Candidatus Kapabacteria bacterium]|nr:hypothetical protein [Candidatus Kapabacteria bacterium]